MWEGGADPREAMDEQTAKRSENYARINRAPLISNVYNKLKAFANDPHGFTAAFVIAIIGVLLGIASGYNLLPCQRQISSGKSCFASEGPKTSSTPTETARPLPSLTPAAIRPPTPEPSPEPSANPEAAARSHRLAALKNEAARWLARQTPEYHDFLPALSAVSNDRELNDDETEALNTLQKAAQIVQWNDRGLNSTTMAALPIFIVEHHTDNLGDRIARSLAEKLRGEMFHIVVSYSDAALIVEIHDAKPNVATYDHGGQYRSTTSFWLRATWVGDKPFFDQPLSRTNFATGLGFDAVSANGRQAEMDSFNDAIDGATSLFLRKVGRQ